MPAVCLELVPWHSAACVPGARVTGHMFHRGTFTARHLIMNHSTITKGRSGLKTHTTCYTFFFFLLGHTHTNCEPLAFFQMPEVWSRRCGLCGSYSPGQHRWLMHRCFCLFWQRLHQINWYCSVFKASLLIFPTSLSHSLPRSVLNLTSTDSVKDEYRLLCTDGTRVPLSSFRKCNFGRGPGGAVVTRINNQNLARKFLSAIQVMSEPYVC